MELSGSETIAAGRMAVWRALNDPRILKRCIAGCESLEGTPEEGFEATVVQKIGPVNAKFKGTVTLCDVSEGRSCTIRGEGKGGVAGFAKGEARVTLEGEGSETRLEYKAEARVGGKIAQLGSRLISGFARKMADGFFAKFKEEVERPSGS